MTRYAKQVLDLINQSNGHMTAEQIFLELNSLCQEGLIRKLSLEGSPDRYDTIRKHDHLVCRTCGALSDITFHDITMDLEKQLGESIMSYDLKVFYLCPKCRGKR